MRVIVMFDLPTTFSSERKEYRSFRKFLIKNGFFMMQESIYSKLALNQSAVKGITQKLDKNKPKSGLVQVLVITEKQYTNMKTLVGKVHSDVVDTDERLVIL